MVPIQTLINNSLVKKKDYKTNTTALFIKMYPFLMQTTSWMKIAPLNFIKIAVSNAHIFQLTF